MTTNGNPQSSALSAELSDALNRSLDTSLSSFASLRKAVRDYTAYHRNRGVPLDTIELDAWRILTEIEAAAGRVKRRDPDLELARQLRKWCREDF